MDPNQLRTEIIRPVLQHIGLWSETAENLVLYTACQESNLRFIKQLGNGPALGIYQMEPLTHDDIWANFLAYRPKSFVDKIANFRNRGYIPFITRPCDEMVGNLFYATAMCRVHYYRRPESLPANDLESLAKYWKRFYNTPLGKGTEAEFIENAKRFGGAK